jgi:cell division transport system permease protein
MCTDSSPTANCIDGRATAAQKERVERILRESDEVKTWQFEDSEEAYGKWREVYASGEDTQQQVIDAIRPTDLAESYWVTLEDPREFRELRQAVTDLRGVGSVRDLRQVLEPIYFWIDAFKWGAIVIAGFLLFAAILQVGNTIRLAAYARRKEIGIMRLVGASSLYIQLPFLLEALFAALLGIVLAGGAIFTFLHIVVYRMLRPNSNLVAWVDYQDGMLAVAAMTVVGLVLTLVPTLLLTRKYLRV